MGAQKPSQAKITNTRAAPKRTPHVHVSPLGSESGQNSRRNPPVRDGWMRGLSICTATIRCLYSDNHSTMAALKKIQNRGIASIPMMPRDAEVYSYNHLFI
jgi:hypothetical protein